MLALAGMAPESVVEGVRVWRPWLAHDESEIFAFARGAPRSRRRGGNTSEAAGVGLASHQVRGALLKDNALGGARSVAENLPCLRDTYGDGASVRCGPRDWLRCAERTRRGARTPTPPAVSTRRVLDPACRLRSAVFRPFVTDRCASSAGWRISRVTAPTSRRGHDLLWKELLRRLFHDLRMAMVSDKAVGVLVKRLIDATQRAPRRLRGRTKPAEGHTDPARPWARPAMPDGSSSRVTRPVSACRLRIDSMMTARSSCSRHGRVPRRKTLRTRPQARQCLSRLRSSWERGA